MIYIKSESEIVSYQHDLSEQIYTAVLQRLRQIGFERNRFYCTQSLMANGDKRITVFYDGKELIQIDPYISNCRVNGQTKVFGRFYISFYHDGIWYNNPFKSFSLSVDEYYRSSINDKSCSFAESLDILLPLLKQEYLEEIGQSLSKIDFKFDSIKYDTLYQRYVIDTNLSESIGSIDVPTEKTRYYKYMSLDTYMNILKSKKFRMNSIMSMNDSSESFFLGDYLCDAYKDNRQKNLYPDLYERNKESLKYNKTVEYKNTLISSFTTLEDNSLMWRLYGDNGKGVCVEYDVTATSIKPVLYIKEQEVRLVRLRNTVNSLEAKGIPLYFNDINNYQFYTKSSQFDYEKEYRILKTCSDDDLSFTKYGDIISFYHDYEFDEVGLRPSILYIGANVPNMDINFPLLVDMSQRELGIRTFLKSGVDKLRI